MSLDRIHDIAGLMQFAAQPVIGTTGTASTIASNQYPGGYQIGASVGFAAGTNSTNGAAQYMPYLPKGSTTNDYQSFSATSGVITHDNMPLVLLSVSTTGSNYNIQQASYDGQLLTIACVGQSASILSTLNTSGIGATTTAACQVAVATTFPATGAVFQAHKLAQTATTNVPYVWRRIL